MEPKESPFSIYDFLGYFVPGSLFLYSLIHLDRSKILDADRYSFLLQIRSLFPAANDEKWAAYILFIIWAYLTGHVLNLVSSYTVEKFAVWSHGYPSKYLLGQKRPQFLEALDKTKLKGNWARRLLCRARFDHLIGCALRVAVSFFLLPIALFEFVIGRLFGVREIYAKSFDPWLASLTMAHITRYFAGYLSLKKTTETANESSKQSSDASVCLDPERHDFFRVIEQVVIESCPNHVQMGQKYVALYGFLRTASLLAVLWFWMPIFHCLVMDWIELDCFTFGAAVSKLPYVFLCVSSMLSFVLFIGFVKFFRRYNQTIILAVFSLPSLSPNHAKAEERLEVFSSTEGRSIGSRKRRGRT